MISARDVPQSIFVHSVLHVVQADVSNSTYELLVVLKVQVLLKRLNQVQDSAIKEELGNETLRPDRLAALQDENKQVKAATLAKCLQNIDENRRHVETRPFKIFTFHKGSFWHAKIFMSVRHKSPEEISWIGTVPRIVQFLTLVKY